MCMQTCLFIHKRACQYETKSLIMRLVPQALRLQLIWRAENWMCSWRQGDLQAFFLCLLTLLITMRGFTVPSMLMYIKTWLVFHVAYVLTKFYEKIYLQKWKGAFKCMSIAYFHLWLRLLSISDRNLSLSFCGQSTLTAFWLWLTLDFNNPKP